MGSSHSKTRHWTEEDDDEEDDYVEPVVAVEPTKKIKSRPFSLIPSIARKMSDGSIMPASPTISPPLSSICTDITSRRISHSSYWASNIPTSARFPKTPPLPTASSPRRASITSTTTSPPLPQSMSPQYPPSISPRNPPSKSYYHTQQAPLDRPPPISPRSLTSTAYNTPLTSPFLPDTRIFRLDPSPTGGTVYAWPSSGGVLMAICSPCELAWLSISETSERFLNPTEEDEFCVKLRGLGAKRFPSIETVGSSTDEETIKVGYPENGRGVWVVRLGGRAAERRSREEHVEYLRTVGELRAARSMDERCEVIRRLGGTYFANPWECEEIN